MKLTHLRCALEIVRHNNHFCDAAKALNASQPGVSRQIQMLEAELGFRIFRRTRNRIIGLTPQGREVVAIAERVVTEVGALESMREEAEGRHHATLTIGTTHIQARYILPKAISLFAGRFPAVRVVLRQGTPGESCAMVEAGEADLAIATEIMGAFPNMVHLPCFSLPRSIIAPKSHPILRLRDVTLKDVASYPIVTYDPGHGGRWRVMNAFRAAGLAPRITLSAMDADVCKTYIGLGLGIGVLVTAAFDPVHDVGLAIRDARHLFEPSTTTISLRADTPPRGFMLDFIQAVAPSLTPHYVRNVLSRARAGRPSKP